MFVMFVIVNRG